LEGDLSLVLLSPKQYNLQDSKFLLYSIQKQVPEKFESLKKNLMQEYQYQCDVIAFRKYDARTVTVWYVPGELFVRYGTHGII
jgi:hypothetical protein